MLMQSGFPGSPSHVHCPGAYVGAAGLGSTGTYTVGAGLVDGDADELDDDDGTEDDDCVGAGGFELHPATATRSSGETTAAA